MPEFSFPFQIGLVTGYSLRAPPTDPEVLQQKLTDFLRPMLQFIDMTISRGGSVLVHCLAGAHRAGTTGTICLLHFGGLSAKQAEITARSLRPVIQLIEHDSFVAKVYRLTLDP